MPAPARASSRLIIQAVGCTRGSLGLSDVAAKLFDGMPQGGHGDHSVAMGGKMERSVLTPGHW